MSKLDLYIDKDGEKLRLGYTTGSCAAAAAKAAAIMLLRREKIENVQIDTPAGIALDLDVENIEMGEDFVSCSIKKDAGDDPDNTDGMDIYAKVSQRDDEKICIDGGFGIGRITKKGLFGEIGDAAINPVPRKMIEQELKKVSNGGYDVCIYAPQGMEVSKKTFNKNIGIEGGISIVGTKGIVYPMSEDALLKTIYLEIDSIKENFGADELLVLTPGNYGESYAEEHLKNAKTVQVSNYIGKALKHAYNVGFRNFLLIGHVGKFSKLSLGAYNTHNEICDLRMEAFVYYLALDGVCVKTLAKVNEFLSAEEAVEFLVQEDLGYIISKMEKGAETRVKKYLKDDDIKVEVKMYSMKRGMNFD
jgi:cobalt-precorrin-5B (C1)-methyltransferase